jgi:predicted  nucleic acid-binding Zn-ribbon protein
MASEVTTMSGPAVIFREIHRLRRHAQNLQEQLDRIPRQLKAQQGKVARQEEGLREAQEGFKKLKVAIQTKEKALKDRHGQIAKYQKQLNEVQSKKEYDALQAEIAGSKKDCQRLEDEILAGMVESDEKGAQLPELEKALGQARGELASFEQQAGVRRTDLQAQLTEALGQLKAVEAAVPEQVRVSYNRIVHSKGADALAAVRDRICTACHTEITVQARTDLGQELFVACRSCGRILYLPEEPRPVVGQEAEA